jgi:uncharacterized RDD family membrane protein YckC
MTPQDQQGAHPERPNPHLAMRPHAYDPDYDPELFDSLVLRRVCAFIIDVVIITLPVALAALFIFLFGLVTFGLGWLLFWLLQPVTVIWAVLYYGFTFGRAASATLGMQLMDLQLRTWYGAPAYFVLGAAHGIAYWISVSVLTPLVLIVCLFDRRRRLLHDLLLGTLVIRTPVDHP